MDILIFIIGKGVLKIVYPDSVWIHRVSCIWGDGLDAMATCPYPYGSAPFGVFPRIFPKSNMGVLKMSKKFAFAFALLISGSALAGGYRFGDRVTAVMETDKGLFFKSAISCPVNRCQVPPTWAEEKRRRAAALLLTAKVTGMPVYFWWNEYTGPDDNSKTPLPADAIAGEIGLE